MYQQIDEITTPASYDFDWSLVAPAENEIEEYSVDDGYAGPGPREWDFCAKCGAKILDFMPDCPKCGSEERF